MRDVVRRLQPGLLAERLKQFNRHLEELAERNQGSERIVLRATPFRAVNPEFFERVAAATKIIRPASQ